VKMKCFTFDNTDYSIGVPA